MIYYSSKNGCIMHISKHQTAFMVLEDFINEEVCKEFLRKVQDIFQHECICNIIFDTSNLEILKKEEIAMLADKLAPIFSSPRLQRIAYLKPHNAFGELSMNLLMDIKANRKIKKFSTLEEAENWVYQYAEVA